MAREIDEAWVEEAIARHRRIELLQGEFDARVAKTEVTVHSPDQLVEVTVGADGRIRGVTIVGSLAGRSSVDVSRSIEAAVSAAADAAEWARRTVYTETFGGYPPLGTFGDYAPLGRP
jgi:DNA-binding protein YbaB